MKKLSTRLSFAITFALFFSCESRFEIAGEKVKIEQARKWFESNILSDAKNQVADPKSTSSIEKEIFWDRARKLPGKSMPDGYAFPIWYETKARFGKQSIRELWIYKERDGKMAATIVEVVAAPEHFYKSGRRIEFKNFSGIISFHDWNEGFLGGFFINKSGRSELVTDYKFKQGDKKELPNDSSARVSDCGYQVSYIQSNGIGGIMWVSQPCFDWNAYYASYIMNMYVMNLYTNYSYCEQLLNEQYGCEYQGNCQAPTSNNYYPEPEPVDYEKQARDEFNYYKIDDSKLKPCMYNVLSFLKGLTNGSVAGVIQKFSGAIPGYNWELVNTSLPNNENAATATKINSQGYITTQFDATKFGNSTDLSVARTILHESIHAYVVAVQYNTASVSDRVLLLGPDWMTVVNNYGHDYITNNYLTPIALALEEYGNNVLGYGLPSQFYQDLAWGGLTNYQVPPFNETALFQQLNPNATDRIRIHNTINTELTGKDFYGNTQTQKGTNAGC
jgi:hypothetical protein